MFSCTDDVINNAASGEGITVDVSPFQFLAVRVFNLPVRRLLMLETRFRPRKCLFPAT